MLKNILIGMGIGVANIIPGISGGTLAVIFGIYNYLIEAISCFFQSDRRKKIEYIKFLFQIGIGAIIGILLFSRIIEYLLKSYPIQTKIIFIIMILPSIPLIIKGENYKKFENILSFILGILFIWGFIYLTLKFPNKNNNLNETENLMSLSYYFKLIFCGIISIGAMIIPGISGSFLLLLMGEYQNILTFINNLNILPLSFFALGILAGGIIFTKIINYFFIKYKSITLFFILGIIIASLISLILTLE